MTSRLSSLLVRDGVIGVKRMEKAFQRQVLFGGALDTILLEMKELTEARLVQYLSLATGLPPATARELESLDPVAVEACPREVAEMFRVVPLSFDDDALRMLARDPVNLAGLEDLASELGLPVQPFVAPEFRFELAFDRAYGRKSDPRFVRIAEAVKDEAPTTPVGRAPSVVVEAAALASGSGAAPVVVGAGGAPAAVTDPASGGILTSAPRTEPGAPAAGAADSAHASGRKTLMFSGVALQKAPRRAPSVPDGIGGDFADEPTPPEITVTAGGAPEPAGAPAVDGAVVERIGPHDTQRVPFVPEDSTASEIASGEISGPEPQPVAGAPGAARVQVTRVEPRSVESAPLNPAEARALLEQAEHRDLVFEILLRAIRGRAWYAAVLTVQGGAAIGRLALMGDEVDQAGITQVLIPLDTASPFKQAIDSDSPYIGPIATGDGEIDAMIKRMGGVVPPSAMLLPISLKNRVVALLVGHRGGDSLRVTEVAELLPLAGLAAEALGRVIRRGKGRAAGVAAAGGPAPAAVPDPVEDEPTGRRGPSGPMAAAASAGPAARPEGARDRDAGRDVHRDVQKMSRLSRETGEPVTARAAAGGPTLDEVMARVQSDDEALCEVAIAEALRRPDEVLPWLDENFPGTLRVDRYELGGRHLKPAQHGGVLDLVIRMGPAVADLLVEKTRDSRREVRYYAVLCAAEMRPEEAVVPLVERLFDTDHGIREVAIEGLLGYPAPSLNEALEIPRRALHGEDLERLKAAAFALAALADVRAIPELLDVHGRGGEAGQIVSEALVGLTKQDFGQSNKKWRHWWDKHRRKNRVEWLLEGLGHKDPAIRKSAVEDLRKATGEYFGFHHDLSKREREAARQRWHEWWNQTGRLRFLPPEEHERNRPTGLLPRDRHRV